MLRSQGYQIVARNVNLLPVGELDIVAEKGGVVHFFEVRTARRGSPVSPVESMGRRKLSRLKKAVELYRKRERMEKGEYVVSLVAVEVDGERVVSMEVIPHVLEGC